MIDQLNTISLYFNRARYAVTRIEWFVRAPEQQQQHQLNFLSTSELWKIDNFYLRKSAMPMSKHLSSALT